MTEKIQLCKEISRWSLTLLEGLTVIRMIKCLELKFILKLFRATNVKISKSPKNKTNQDM